MARAIRAASIAHGGARSGRFWGLGPDEDRFTLGVASAESLSAGPPIDFVGLVGDWDAGAEWAVPEALGAPNRLARRYGGGPGGLGAALVGASLVSGSGRSLVVVSDVPPDPESEPTHGAAAIAFALSDGPGWVPTGHGSRRHPLHRTPDAAAWVASALEAAKLPDGTSYGHLILVARASPPVLLRSWTARMPGMKVLDADDAPPGVGPAPTIPLGLAIRGGEDAPGAGVVAAVIDGETTDFLGFQRTGPVSWTGAVPVPPADSAFPAAKGMDGSIDAVSEGAYVPRARYLENLPAHWRFEAERCSACRRLNFPPRGRCRGCGSSEALVPEELPREGVVESSTTVAPGAQPTEFDPWVGAVGTYGVVLVRLAEEVRVTLQVTGAGPTPLSIGSRVRTSLRRLYATEGEWRYGRKATPVRD